MYRRMRLDDLVAKDPAAYVAMAVRLANDRDRRAEVVRSILERNAVLFENAAVVSEFERFFREAARRA
jgi:predicted O-linked N-acetylglucosamine transferase (SPINDLY family)